MSESGVAEKQMGSAAVPGKWKWLALIAIFFAHIAVECQIGVTGGVGARLTTEWGITAGDVGLLTSASFLTGVVFGLPFGFLGDRMKVSAAMSLGIVISLVGTWARWALFPMGSFEVYYATTFVIGFGLAGLNANSIKFLSAWFGNKISLPMGFYVAGAPVGITLGVQFPALFADTAMVLLSTAIVTTVGVAVWLLFARTPKGFKSTGESSKASDYFAVLKQPWIWIASLCIAIPMGAGTTFSSMMTAAVVDSKGVTEMFANNMVTLNSFGMMIVGMVFPFLLNKIGNSKIQASILVASLGIAVICIFAWFIPDGTIAVFLLGFTGFFVGITTPMGKAILGMLRVVIDNPQTMGAAGGLQAVIQNLGGWLIPTGVAVAAGADNYMLFLITGVLFLISGVIAFAIPRKQMSFDE